MVLKTFLFKDCHDINHGNSTEANCSESEFRCLMNKFYCIHNSWKCDGDTDCPDGSDESVQVCGIAQACRSDQFTCDNGECIPGHLQCSGSSECSDGSDEKLCRKYIDDFSTVLKAFFMKRGVCFPWDFFPFFMIYDLAVSVRFIGLLFAGDPEIGCDQSSEFDCGGEGKMCIPLDKVCDRQNDCGNWADEPQDRCGVNECSQSLQDQAHRPLCDQQCIDLPIGYKCACKEGYQLVDNSTCKGQLLQIS